MHRSSWPRTALSLIALLAVLLIAYALTRSAPEAVPDTTHPPYDADLACDASGCHDRTHEHQQPYVGACDTCHGIESWRFVLYTHADGDFNIGLHGVVGCVRCHTEGEAPPDKQCGTCHQAPHGGSPECAKCHMALTWLLRGPIPTGHVSLQGGHSNLTCFDCHPESLAPQGQQRTCVDCHGQRHGGLTDCAACHDVAAGWKPGAIDHSAFYELTGSHTNLQCTQCHPGGRFAGTSPDCSSCHGTRHGGLSACGRCHTTASFTPSTFRHCSVWNIVGGPHARLSCNTCHPSGRYAYVRGKTCVGCHGRTHGLTVCTPCHSNNGAVRYPIDHSKFMPLVGGPHATLACTRCHRGSDFSNERGKDCVSCHGRTHGDPTPCVTCHAANGAVNYPFDHTPFMPLAGGPHATLACTQCHPGNNYPVERGKNCLSCHGPKHDGRTVCTPCHIANGALAIPLPHPSAVPLGAAHTARPCSLCHTALLFNATRECSDCHTAPHVGPTDCLRCHWPTTWADIHYNYATHVSVLPHDITEFPCLDGCHVGDFTQYTCTRCH